MLLKNEKPPFTADMKEGQSKKTSTAKIITTIGPQSQEVLQSALMWASQGVPVVPCQEWGTKETGLKKPYLSNGFHGASTDSNTIASWWRRWPNALLGIVCSADSGIMILDIDMKDGINGIANFHQLVEDHGGTYPETRTEKTPSGGLHFFFKHRDGVKRSVSKLALNIDVMTNGHVVIAPSICADGRAYKALNALPIAEMDDWLFDLITSLADKVRQVDAVKDRPPAAPAAGDTPYGLAALEDECNGLAATLPGSQNDELSRSAFRMGQLVAGGQLTQETAESRLWSTVSMWEGLNEHKTRDTLTRQLKEGMAHPKAPEPKPEEAATKSKAPMPTEDSLALQFTALYDGKFVFCHDSGSWYHWDGVHWKKDRTRYPLQLMREICRAKNEDAKPVLGKMVTASGALKFAAGDLRMAVTSEIWDTDIMRIGTPGGVVDLRTGILSPGRPDMHITKLAGVAPADTADCPRWLYFLGEATRGDQELQRFMRQLAGLCLTGDTSEHALFFVYGPGGNGKSVFLNILTAILGDYAATAAMTTFTASNSDQHPTDLAMLRGARLVSVSETEDGRAWAESRIKQLTGGDKITARFMRQDFFEYVPQFKLLIVGNHQPTLRNVDDAARRRFNIIPFVHKPTSPDPDLEDKIKAELPGILRWAIDGCLDWQQHGLVRPECVIAATQEYFSQQDIFGQWLDESCERGPRLWSETKALYESWVKYARANGEEPGDVRKFGPLLSKAGFIPHRTMAARGFKGLVLKRQEEWQEKYDI